MDICEEIANVGARELLRKFEAAYHPDLRTELDEFADSGRTMDRSTLNQVTLFKVGRYASMPDKTLLSRLRSLRNQKLNSGCHDEIKAVSRDLLRLPGVALPLASAMLRFTNPDAFPIVDRHAYKVLLGKPFVVYHKKQGRRLTEKQVDHQVSLYCRYLRRVAECWESLRTNGSDIRFRDMDRVLYQFDKGKD